MLSFWITLTVLCTVPGKINIILPAECLSPVPRQGGVYFYKGWCTVDYTWKCREVLNNNSVATVIFLQSIQEVFSVRNQNNVKNSMRKTLPTLPLHSNITLFLYFNLFGCLLIFTI